jgi:hypothetical protein
MACRRELNQATVTCLPQHYGNIAHMELGAILD